MIVLCQSSTINGLSLPENYPSPLDAFALASGPVGLRESPTAPADVAALKGTGTVVRPGNGVYQQSNLLFEAKPWPSAESLALQAFDAHHSSRSARAGADPSEAHEAVVMRPAQTGSDVLK